MTLRKLFGDRDCAKKRNLRVHKPCVFYALAFHQLFHLLWKSKNPSEPWNTIVS